LSDDDEQHGGVFHAAYSLVDEGESAGGGHQSWIGDDIPHGQLV